MTVRLLSIAGILLSGWLLYQKAAGSITYLVGCGAGSGCANVLGSRWSQWLLIPVTAPALALYATLLFLTFRPHRTALLAVATSLAAAAIWFGIVQAFILQQFCPWCLAAHTIGLIAAISIFRQTLKSTPAANPKPSRKKQPAPTLPSAKPGILAGLAASSILILGQIFGPIPQTHQTSDLTLPPTPTSSSSPATPEPVHQRGSGRKVTFLTNKIYHLDSLPHLGDPAAPNVLVKYFDYACDACRDQHEDLEAFQQKHPGKFCIILLPCPIQRSCNPNLPSHVIDHPNACTLARLALACWRTDPASFPKIHHTLFARPTLDPAKALETVTPLLTKPLPQTWNEDPWINEILAANTADYKRINVTNSGQLNYLMPKLLVGGTRMLHGVTRTREILFQALEQEFKLTPP